MTLPEGTQTFAGRLATFENPHHLPKRRASSTKKKGAGTLSWPASAPSAEEVGAAFDLETRMELTCILDGESWILLQAIFHESR